MADKAPSALTAAGTLDGTEIVHVVKGGNSRRTTTQAIADLGGSSITAPVVRSSKIESSSASSYNLTWPSGAAAGDVVVIFAAHGFALTNPSGWIVLDNKTGTNWNGGAWAKQLTAADITAGGVTLSAGGSFNGCIAQICFTGVTGDIRQTVSERNGSGGSPRSVATAWTPVTTDMVIAFGSNRNANSPTCSFGTQLEQINAASASGVLSAASPSADGAVTASFTYPTISGTTGDYNIVVVLKGIG